MLFIRKSSIFLSLFVFYIGFHEQALAIKQSYIVYLGPKSHGSGIYSGLNVDDGSANDVSTMTDSHYSLLANYMGGVDNAKAAIFDNYDGHINGFAANLDETEASELAKHPEVVSVFPDKLLKVMTTHSWEFMSMEKKGLIDPSSIWEKADYGSNAIIATLDTGVWPESESFSDNGIGPTPSKWRGACDFPKTTSCNKKLIGARYFNKGYKALINAARKLDPEIYDTPRDLEGHGTHTLSTAGGNFVHGASVFGIGNGTAKGGSPKARVASYKVCWPQVANGSCPESDIIKGIDTAISDGVDVLSISLGGDSSETYFSDGIAIGTFHAVKNGIAVVASAGNSGPQPSTVSNVAPWIITVAASNIDRKFQANVHLANGKILEGVSLSKPLPTNSMYPLIAGGNARASNSTSLDASLCEPGTLDPAKVKGKILVCQRGKTPRLDKSVQALLAGAAGMILANGEQDSNDLQSDSHVLPATQVNFADGQIIYDYIRTSKGKPEGLIAPPTAVLNTTQAPVMAAFSSRGPNLVTPEILKPDITAPGVTIIAAYTGATSPTGEPIDTRRTPFIAMSGTSMSCPHVSGIVGLLKTLHPEWSPAAIRSAIMTTAKPTDSSNNPILDADHTVATPFAYGNGHVDPTRSMDPGLVYDVSTEDYLHFLCGIGYNNSQLFPFTDEVVYKCPKNYDLLSFNNPSISVPRLVKTASFTRKLKNVGTPGTYTAKVQEPEGFSVSVDPSTLKFEKIGEEKTFTMTVAKAGKTVDGSFKFGELIWSDQTHSVRSSIAVASAAM